MISGAQAMVKCLRNEGVGVVFGYPGATIAPFYDSLLDSEIRHILSRGEQSAGHAANGYARVSGKVGVCITTSGPGATNLFTALATAYSDSIPLVAITGQVATSQQGRDVFQEVDTTGATSCFTKYNYLIKSADQIPTVFKEAFHIASTGRKGPVVIDVPVDVQRQMTAFNYPDSVSIRGYKPNYEGHPLQVEKVAKAINSAQRPLICSGGGLMQSDDPAAIIKFCDQTGIPMVSTMMGIGALPTDHPLYFGMIGQSGHRVANQAIRQCDLLVLIGARVGDRAITQPLSLESRATIVHIDIDSAEIGKNMGASIPLVGEASRIINQLCSSPIHGDWRAWLAELHENRQKQTPRNATPGFVNPNWFIGRLCGALPDDVLFIADVGQNQLWAARNFSGSGRFMTTGGMGTMGYALPAAIGARLASPRQTVVAVCGDGGFQMSMNELATMCQHDAPVKIIIMRNNRLGLVREIQEHSFGGRHIAVDLAGSPDFGIIAQAYGIEYALADSAASAEAAIERMLAGKGAFIVECLVDPMEETL